MLARRTLPPEFAAWNQKWGAPYGRPGFRGWPLRGTRFDAVRRGPFAGQNNSTREFEYPWVYHQVSQLGAKRTIVEIGGSVGGMQFVLAREGHTVINVDPGQAATGRGWALSPEAHAWLGRRFGVDVQLVLKTIQESGLPDNLADAVVCISALEHFSDVDRNAAAVHIRRILKPGGVLVMTVDLFLDLEPFCDRAVNEYGRNVNVREWLAQAGLELVTGTPAELRGFEGFSPNAVLRELSQYHVGSGYPALAQCLVARKG